MTRRQLFRSLGYLGLLLFSASPSFANFFNLFEGARTLNLYSINTGESLKLVYWVDGIYINSSLEEINHLLRDYRSGEVAPIDIRLLDVLYMITKLSERERIVVVSGYRSPSTNLYLHMKKRGVAKDSYHTLGKAVDIRVEGLSLQSLKDIALSLKAGGVGYYPRSGFVHLDTGAFRYWG